jgi:ketosteroid isomerase-like protein
LAGGCRETDDLARELVTKSVPRHWEITCADIQRLTTGHDRIVVVGALSCRPKGGSDSINLPFLHIWYIRDSKVTRVVSSLDSVELRRAA